SHSTSKVPFILCSDEIKKLRGNAKNALCDIAPTMLELLNIPEPAEMTGKSLILK
ncbi:MAG: 2,3-bisphosphoglycerate-independent phosphoglycerate mutase, partial [Actinobacteria bacterium]|nr:2,3-bisphosphoglycerate-independent phosphoglycerate mutase [Actinomycetota bacterium]